MLPRTFACDRCHRIYHILDLPSRVRPTGSACEAVRARPHRLAVAARARRRGDRVKTWGKGKPAVKLPRGKFLHLAAARPRSRPCRASHGRKPSRRGRSGWLSPSAGRRLRPPRRPSADKLKPLLGTVVIENIGGGGASLGAAAVVRAPPDGYTILLGGTETHVDQARPKAGRSTIRSRTSIRLRAWQPIVSSSQCILRRRFKRRRSSSPTRRQTLADCLTGTPVSARSASDRRIAQVAGGNPRHSRCPIAALGRRLQLGQRSAKIRWAS